MYFMRLVENLGVVVFSSDQNSWKKVPYECKKKCFQVIKKCKNYDEKCKKAIFQIFFLLWFWFRCLFVQTIYKFFRICCSSLQLMQLQQGSVQHLDKSPWPDWSSNKDKSCFTRSLLRLQPNSFGKIL